jgi:hypothetical protein
MTIPDINPEAFGFKYDKTYGQWVLNYGSDIHIMILTPTNSDGYPLVTLNGKPQTYTLYDAAEGDSITFKTMMKRIFQYGREDGAETLKTRFLQACKKGV